MAFSSHSRCCHFLLLALVIFSSMPSPLIKNHLENHEHPYKFDMVISSGYTVILLCVSYLNHVISILVRCDLFQPIYVMYGRDDVKEVLSTQVPYSILNKKTKNSQHSSWKYSAALHTSKVQFHCNAAIEEQINNLIHSRLQNTHDCWQNSLQFDHWR